MKDRVALRPSSEKTQRSSSMSEGSDAVVNKGGLVGASRGFNPGVGAYFTVCGPISRRQSEPARIHHRVTPRNNFPGHNELLSKPSYLFISPRPLLRLLLRSLSLSRLLSLTFSSLSSAEPTPKRYPFATWHSAHFSKPKKISLRCIGTYSFFFLRNSRKVLKSEKKINVY